MKISEGSLSDLKKRFIEGYGGFQDKARKCGIEKINFSIGVKHKKPDLPDFPSGRLFTVSSEDEWQIYRGFMLGKKAKDYELVGAFSRLIMVNLLDRSVILFNPNNQKPRLIFKPKVFPKLLDENSG